MVSEQVMTGNVGDYNNHHPTLPKFECCEEMRGDIHEFASEYGYNTFMMGKKKEPPSLLCGPDILRNTGAISGGGGGGDICKGCETIIKDKYIFRVLDASWHEQCLYCSVCNKHLENTCYVKGMNFYCREDYDRYFGTKCSACLGVILTKEFVMKTMDMVFHLHCFKCSICTTSLNKGDHFMMRRGQILCENEFKKDMNRDNSLANHLNPLHSWSEEDSCSDDETDSKGPKRPRTILTTLQRKRFKCSFELNPKPCRKIRESLAAETGLTVRVVQVWFQNQRAKVKKMARRQQLDPEGKKISKNGKRKRGEDDSSDEESILNEHLTDNKSDLNNSVEYTLPYLGQSEDYSSMSFNHAAILGGVGVHNNNHRHVDSFQDNADAFGKSLDGRLDDATPLLNVNDARPELGTQNTAIDRLCSMQNNYFSNVQ